MTMILILILPTYGQDSTYMSMEEAVEYGLKNHSSIQIAEKNIEYHQWSTDMKKSAYLPEIISSADYRNNPVLPVTILPGDIFGNSQGPVEIKMGTRHSLRSGINIKQPLYDAVSLSGIRQAAIEEEMADNNLASTRKNIALQIKNSYLLCLYNLELLQLTKNTCNIYAALAEISSVKHKNGLISDSELEDALNKKKTSEIELRISNDRYDNSIKELKLKIDYPSGVNIKLSDSILPAFVRDMGQAGEDYNIKRLPAWISLSLQKRMNEEMQKMLRGRYLPRLNLYGFVGAQYYDDNFSPLANDQRWFGQSYIGLSMNLPLFEGLEKRRNMKALNIKQKNIIAEKERLEKEVSQRKEIIITELGLSRKNAELADTRLKHARGKLNDSVADYETGIISYGDVLRADLEMRLKKQEYVSALYEIMLTRIEYEQLISVY